MFCLNHRSIKVTLFSEIHIKIISKISLTYHQIAYIFQIYHILNKTILIYICITFCEAFFLQICLR